MNKSVFVVDCDPQCNASQYICFETMYGEKIFRKPDKNIEHLFTGLMAGEGHADKINIKKSTAFGVDVLCGSPGLSLAEDFLAEEWALPGSVNPHYFLSSTEISLDLRHSLRRNRNLKTLSYDKIDNDHSGLVNAMETLLGKVSDAHSTLIENNNW